MSDNKIKIAEESIVGLLGLTFLALLVLKLTKLATISWLWVLFPLWIGPAAVIGILIVAAAVTGCIFGVAKFLDYIDKRRRLKKRKK